MFSLRLSRGRLVSSLTLGLATALLSLAGCGGGSGGGSTSPSNAAATGDFTVAETRQGNALGASSRQVVVLDKLTHKVVKTFALDRDTNYAYLVNARQQVVNANTGKILGDSQLFVIQGGKVMQLDLRGPTLGNAVQVSSLTNACFIDDKVQAELNLDGTQTWLLVATPGADGQCTTTVDNGYVLVLGGSSSTTAPIPAGANGLEIIDSLDGSTPGVPTGILVFNRASATLAVYSTDLQTPKQVITPGGQTLNSSALVENLGYMPTDLNKFILRVNDKLYMASYAQGSLSLSVALYTLTDTAAEPPVVYAGSDAYVVTSTELIKVSTAPSATLVRAVNASAGGVAQATLVNQRVVVSQWLSQGESILQTLTAYPLDGGAPTPMTTSTDFLTLLGVSGEHVVVGKQSSATWMDIIQYDTLGGAGIPMASNVNWIKPVDPDTVVGGSNRAPAQLLYCQGGPGAESCAGNPLVSLDLATGATLTLGTFPTEAPGTTALALGTWDFADVVGKTASLTVWLATSTDLTSAVWTYNPSVAGSLTRVTGTP